MTIRALLRLISNVIDICHDYRCGLRNVPNETLDIDTITDRLCDLRDILESLFKSLTIPAHAAGFTSLVVNELLSRCRNEIVEMETTLNQESGRGNVTRLSSAPGLEVILGRLALSTTALKGLIGRNRTYDSNHLGFNLMLIIGTKAVEPEHCWRF